MAGKRVKAATKGRKTMNKMKKAARALSPSGVADVLGDYLLHGNKRKKGAKRVKAKVNGRN